MKAAVLHCALIVHRNVLIVHRNVPGHSYPSGHQPDALPTLPGPCTQNFQRTQQKGQRLLKRLHHTDALPGRPCQVEPLRARSDCQCHGTSNSRWRAKPNKDRQRQNKARRTPQHCARRCAFIQKRGSKYCCLSKAKQTLSTCPGCCSYCTADCLQDGRPCSALWCSCTFLFRLTQRWRKASRCMRRMTCCFTVATWQSMTTLSFPAWCRGHFWVGVLTNLHAAALGVAGTHDDVTCCGPA